MNKVSDVQNIIEGLVDPREKKNARISDLTVFSEIKNEHKKLKIQKLKKPKKKLSRNEFKELGLYALPRKTLKYNEYLPLNELWNNYMQQQFGNCDMKTLKSKFDPGHSQYNITSAIIHKSDFHGAKVKVKHSKCASLVGMKGIILIDSKGTFQMIGKDNILRVIPKNDSIFELKWNSGVRFIVLGKHICYRTADRSTKKVKNVALADL